MREAGQTNRWSGRWGVSVVPPHKDAPEESYSPSLHSQVPEGPVQCEGPVQARFVTSVAWRTAVVTVDSVLPAHHGSRPAADLAIEAWRRYLLDPLGTCPTDHELWVLGTVQSFRHLVPSAVPVDDFADFIARDGVASVVAGDFGTAVCCKLPGILLWSHVQGNARPGWPGWQGTRVAGGGTLSAERQEVSAPEAIQMVSQWAAEFGRARGELSAMASDS